MSLSVIRKRRFPPKKVLNIKLYIHVLGLQTLKFIFFYMLTCSYLLIRLFHSAFFFDATNPSNQTEKRPI